MCLVALLVLALFCSSWQDPHGGGTARRSRIGGLSGGVPNDELVKELKEVALEHVRVAKIDDNSRSSRIVVAIGHIPVRSRTAAMH